MKAFSLILNIVLVIAVAILYFLHFSQKKIEPQTNHVASLSNLLIAYVNSDSLLDQYTYFKNRKTAIEEKQNSIKMELNAESTKLQRDIEDYQKNAQFMSELERGRKEEQLTMQQQKLMQKKEELVSKLDAEQEKSSEDLFNKLSAYLKEYNKGKNYSFILGHQKGGGILFANDSLNITKEVVEGLNKSYENEKKDK